MSEFTLPEEWRSLCSSENAEGIRECITSVFRRLLSNLLLEFNNPKFRQVKKDNNTLRRFSSSLPEGFVDFLFWSIGFVKRGDTFSFEGSMESLKQGDAILTHIEESVERERLRAVEWDLDRLRRFAAERTKNSLLPKETPPPPALPPRAQLSLMKTETNQAKPSVPAEDLADGEAVKETVRKTLLNTGRLRNSFFDARDFVVRSMRHGRSYACTQKCSDHCVEAHWHLLTGRNIVYSHLAHLSADGTRLLHLGPEHGYQYNSLPGSENFRKMVHFSEKLMDENGKLVAVKTNDKSVKACIYCGRAFAELLL
ncbi:hypothetical protein JKF63_06872 [Porcisia hertigi]|uniref:PUB domain-containing protein n=1 Tax=Porcisia hertigi TaxID=2761500 RepID=A0A836LJA1_9TRYP|nr:hypothetical protein JKF63_06872 [Porcisia hertigi]